MFTAQNLKFQYSPDTAFAFPDITLKHQEHLLIIGASGVGKTTLLHLLARLLPPKQGTLSLNGQSYEALNHRQLDRFRGQQIGIVFQKNHFIAAINVLENLLLIQRLGRGKPDKVRAMQVLEALDIEGQATKLPSKLSQGQQQRLGIAMALVNQPKLLLADEPTSSLDDQNCQRVIELLKSEARKNQAHLIVITHDQRIKPQFEKVLEL